MDYSILGFPVHHQLLKLAQTHVHWVSDAIQPSHSLLLLPSIFPSIRVFSNESVLHIRWPKYWSFCFSIRPPNEYSGLISFRIDWFDLLAVQGTLKSLLQHHNFTLIVKDQCSAAKISPHPRPAPDSFQFLYLHFKNAVNSLHRPLPILTSHLILSHTYSPILSSKILRKFLPTPGAHTLLVLQLQLSKVSSSF